EIIQAILNAPAYVIAAPMWWIFNLQTAEQHHPVLFIASSAMWFSVGHWIDSGMLAAKRTPLRPWFRIALAVVAGVATYVVVREVSDGATWWSKYGGLDLASILILVRIIGFVPWCVFVAALGARTVIRWRTC